LPALALIGLAVLGGHGLSLWSGLTFDDYVHRQALRDAGWSLGDMVRAARVGETGGTVKFWWDGEHFIWKPFRPFCFLVMKMEYTLVGWRPAGMHVFCLLWHAGCAGLVIALALRFLGDRRWALFAGLLFALHPGHGATCERIADQNEVMATFFLLASVLAYGKYARWPRGLAAARESDLSSLRSAPGQSVWLISALLFFCLGLGCRENAVVVPVLVFVFDWLIGPLRWRRRLVGYACFAVLTAGYLALRSSVLGGMPTPGLPYMYPPSEPGFLRFVFEKLLFYQLGLYLYVPALQLDFFEFFQRNPVLLYGLAGVTLAALVTLVARVTRPPRAWWGLLLWPMICTGPVLFVFAGLHHLYMPSTGSSVLLAGLLMNLGLVGRSPFWTRLRKPVAVVGLVGYAAGSIATSVLCYGLTQAERGYALRLAESLGTVREGDFVFVLNYPPLACSTPPAVAEAVGVRHLSVMALSIRPREARETRAVPLDDHRLVLLVPARDVYENGQAPPAKPFESLVERQIMLLIPAAAGLTELPPVGTVLPGGQFDARYVGTDELKRSVWVLDFSRPLASPRYHFCAFKADGSVERMHVESPVSQELTPALRDLLEPAGAQRAAPANG
jgi:hypothetical protein